MQQETTSTKGTSNIPQPRATYTYTTRVFIPGTPATPQPDWTPDPQVSAAVAARAVSVTITLDLQDLADALRPFLSATPQP
jgi:hypothetical protein